MCGPFSEMRVMARIFREPISVHFTRLHNDNTFTSPGKFCPQSKNLIPLGCTISGVDESGCLP
jgi:hypothetical protein